MKVFTTLSLALFALTAGALAPSTFALKDVVSIIQLADGKFDILCMDHSREIVTSEDIKNENLCPYIAPISKKIDVLFVIDNSGSMSTHMQSLAQFSQDIIARLSAENMDYQIAVTTTEAYKADFTSNPSLSEFISLSGHSIITNKTPNPSQALQLNVDLEPNGDGDERAFQSLKSTLNNPQNSAFLRDEALLHVVILSDEDDFSHDNENAIYDQQDPALHSPTIYFDYLMDKKANSPLNDKLKVSAIAIFDQACLDTLIGAFTGSVFGHRYGELVHASGGKTIDICSMEMPF